MLRALLAALAVLLFAPAAASATVIPVNSGGSLSNAYNQAQSGDEIVFDCGSYTDQTVPSGSKTVTVRAQTPGCAKLRSLISNASNVTFDGLDLDEAGSAPNHAVFETGGQHDVTFKNGSIGNVVDEKGALLGGNTDPSPLNVVIDNVRFHDVRPVGAGTHNECIYLMAPGTVIRNSTFEGTCGNTGAILTQRGSWWGQQPFNGLKFLNNTFARQLFDHGSILFGNHCGDIGATCRDIEIRGNSFDSHSMPGNATPDLSYVNSFESCNTADGAPTTLNLPGFTHEACGVDPDPTPTPTPTPSPTPTPTPTPSPTPTPTPTPSPTPTPTPTPTPPPAGFVGRNPPGPLTDWSGSGEMDGWDFTVTTPGVVDRICGQPNVANSGVTSVDLAIYVNGSRKATGRFTGNPGSGRFCVTIPQLTVSGTVRLAWVPHGNRLNFQGVAGSYIGVTGVSTPPATWPGGGGQGSTGAFIWAD